jgi:hypothetical protein
MAYHNKRSSIFVTTNSSVMEDHILKTDIYNAVARNINFTLHTKNTSQVNVLDCPIDDIDRKTLKDVIIIVYNRVFEEFDDVKKTKDKILSLVNTTEYLIIVYPGHAIQMITQRAKKIKDQYFIPNIGRFTYPMQTGSRRIARKTSDAFMLLYSISIVDDKTWTSTLTELPPTHFTHVSKGINCGFIPISLPKK